MRWSVDPGVPGTVSGQGSTGRGERDYNQGVSTLGDHIRLRAVVFFADVKNSTIGFNVKF